jgi:hypothetical protein
VEDLELPLLLPFLLLLLFPAGDADLLLSAAAAATVAAAGGKTPAAGGVFVAASASISCREGANRALAASGTSFPVRVAQVVLLGSRCQFLVPSEGGVKSCIWLQKLCSKESLQSASCCARLW